jgi:hypothetical protein
VEITETAPRSVLLPVLLLVGRPVIDLVRTDSALCR